jgi:transposase
MRFYTTPHRYYCGIDLHARRMYICVLDAQGTILVHRNGPATPEHFLATIGPYRADVVVAVECIFTWYWVADLCAQEGIPFVLGHALYMKAIHGGKAKNDKIDAHKIAVLLRGGCCRWRTSTRGRCAPPVISCADAATSCASGPS